MVLEVIQLHQLFKEELVDWTCFDEISLYSSGSLTAPDDETYNGYPFVSQAISITTGGLGLACGECFELTGLFGTITVMNAMYVINIVVIIVKEV